MGEKEWRNGENFNSRLRPPKVQRKSRGSKAAKAKFHLSISLVNGIWHRNGTGKIEFEFSFQFTKFNFKRFQLFVYSFRIKNWPL